MISSLLLVHLKLCPVHSLLSTVWNKDYGKDAVKAYFNAVLKPLSRTEKIHKNLSRQLLSSSYYVNNQAS